MLFRSVKLHYEKKVTYKGINALRFITSDDFLAKIGPNYDNECFCTGTIEKVPVHSDGCLYAGAMDMSPCLGISSLIILLERHFLLFMSTNARALIRIALKSSNRYIT